jgi:hypothetical protein
MILGPCSSRAEVQQMVARGHWPHACSPQLRAHLTSCKACAEFVLLREVFEQSRTAALAEARLPAAGAIWWRAQLARRSAAVERMGRPTLGAYAFLLGLTLAVGAGLILNQARHGLRWLDWFVQPPGTGLRTDFSPSLLLSGAGSFPILIAVLATAALVGAVVVCLVAEKK